MKRLFEKTIFPRFLKARENLQSASYVPDNSFKGFVFKNKKEYSRDATGRKDWRAPSIFSWYSLLV